MVLYLRVVHSYDFFSGTMVHHEHGLAQRMGFLTVPNVGVFMGTPVDDWRDRGWAVADSIDEFKDFPESKAPALFGTEDDIVNDLVERNTEKLGPELFRCLLSGKKFRAPGFVSKHILTKHSELVEKTKQDVEYSNNYIRDIFRCRTLPMNAQHERGNDAIAHTPMDTLSMVRPPLSGANIGAVPMGGPPGMLPSPFSDPNKDEFGRDIPAHRRDRYRRRHRSPPVAQRPPVSLTRSKSQYDDLF